MLLKTYLVKIIIIIKKIYVLFLYLVEILIDAYFEDLLVRKIQIYRLVAQIVHVEA